MTSKHKTPQYQRNARLRRAEVRRRHQLGDPVACWRCGLPIHPGQPFDIGHINDSYTSDLTDLAPEHRHGTRACLGNRAAGGKIGAAITNGGHSTRRPASEVTTWRV